MDKWDSYCFGLCDNYVLRAQISDVSGIMIQPSVLLWQNMIYFNPRFSETFFPYHLECEVHNFQYYFRLRQDLLSFLPEAIPKY